MKAVFFHFDFGRSYRNDVDVRSQLLDRLPNTLYLVARRRGRVARHRPVGRHDLRGQARLVPRPLLHDHRAGGHLGAGLLARALSRSISSRTTSAASRSSLARAPSRTRPASSTKVESLIMPWFVLATAFAAIYARLLRANLLEVLGEDYIRTARAKGLGERRVIFHHGMRSALTPIVTVLGLDIGILVGGAILTESVFNIPGIGRLTYDAIQRGDIITVQGATLFLASRSASATCSSTSSTPSSTRGCGCHERAAPLRPRPPGPLRHRRRPRQGGRRRLLRRRPRPHARHRRRVGLGQVGVLAHGDGADALEDLDDHRRDPLRRPRPADAVGRRDARDPRRGDRDDLPGPAVLAASLLPHRRPARGGGPGPPQGLQGGGARQGRGAAAAGRHPGAARTASAATRTSSPAACASA